MLPRTLNSTFGGRSSSSGGSSFGVISGYADASPYTAKNSNRMAVRDMRKRDRDVRFPLDKFAMTCLATILLGIAAIYYRSSYHFVLTELQTQRAIEVANNENKLDANMIEKFEAERNYMTKRERTWQDYASLMQHSIQSEAWRTVMERFGPGPHHVTFTLKFHDSGETGSFKIELAPLSMLPHVNHFFLEQVYHELWDGTWFYLNGAHVLQAGPQDWEEENAGKALARFKETRLDQLTFPEYHPEFPHKAWTLGYAGRPGGPDWYINKVDNSIAHGPGGQWHEGQQDGLKEQADSCFAKVIEGHNVLQRIFQADSHAANSNYPYFLHEPVEILTARIDEKVEDKINRPQKIDNTNTNHHNPQRRNVNQESLDEEREKKSNNQYR